ncbi:MAG: hemolysin family protein [Thermoanaerobaculia bacterium]|nr:hemolysin family protein [Thermoanaerobaculia bacterium]
MPESSFVVALVSAGLVFLLGLTTAVMSALLERSGTIRLHHWSEEAGGALEVLSRRRGRFEVYRLLLSMIARFALVGVFWFCGVAIGSWWIGTVAAFVLLLASEVASRLLVARSSERALLRLTPVYGAMLTVLKPLIVALRPLLPAATMFPQDDEIEIDEASEGEIDAYISVGQREGILEPGEELLVKGVVEFGDTLVKSAMTPRIDMVAAPLSSSVEELLELFVSSGHSRLPIYRESPDQIVGVLHLRDLVAAQRRGGSVDVEAILLPPFIVPETKPIAVLLREFQARRQQLAVAVDEFGGTAGVATVEDLLEEIVGDIADEHEEQDVEKVQLDEGVWQLSGSFDVEELEDLFPIELDETPYETVGGLVFTTLGRLPELGETVRRHGLEFEVREVEGRRIQKVRVRLPKTSEA